MALKKIAIIPARSGSKGLPNKNILMLLDKPLMAYTIEAALNSKLFERVIVSTDSLEYKEIAEKYGAEVIVRDKELASDKATSFMVIEDVLKKISQYDYFVLLQPTSPFRDKVHIRESIEIFESNSKNEFLVSVTESEKSIDLIKPIDSDHSLKYFDIDFSNYRRQDSQYYTPNGAIFIGYNNSYLKKKHFFGSKSIAYFMSKKDSIDIDNILDFELAICIQTKKEKEKILLKNIKYRINEKKDLFNKKHPITLIGHSIFDNWDIKKINGKSVNNLGISGINSKEYIELILNKNLITCIGDIVVIFSGTNDIVVNNWKPEKTWNWINNIAEKILSINPNADIYILSTPPVKGRIDRNNHTIELLNEYLDSEIHKSNSKLKYIKLSRNFYDDFGNLKSDFTYDGLHFTQDAYLCLEKELGDALK
ncbi:GDSL-type esterase/lipase family protein [Providencia alcalifaciens]|uniref:cytidylyltransferase domain-containing protein n=1 Tax=Providencia TaxID=586 RepID=UPI0018E890CD|nr:GDSL-type esterase/lipase family protein [Providencia rettgeri]MBN6353351.1 acylneuraminate cytidylyltransferase [Providencia rettgeri]QQE93219.1 acylneuraminate cytidylyltransferase [Providencia rettgeri]QWJ91682.1 acylneuraminate cytidylyltransferase [Providencia rettgeri]QXB90229.1 acylneuraminate cytidylyltransferase [Providencia rettgeri]